MQISPGSLLICGCGGCVFQVGIVVSCDSGRKLMNVLWTAEGGATLLQQHSYYHIASVSCLNVVESKTQS